MRSYVVLCDAIRSYVRSYLVLFGAMRSYMMSYLVLSGPAKVSLRQRVECSYRWYGYVWCPGSVLYTH